MIDARTDPWEPHPDVDVDAINADLESGKPTVDVAMYYPDNLDPAHHAQVNVDLLVDGLTRAREIFGRAGVQLRLTWFKTGHLDPSLFAVRASKPGTDLPMGGFANMYVQAERRRSTISDEARVAFETMIGNPPRSDLIVHVVTLQQVFMEYHEPTVENRILQPQMIETGGLSFPGYMHGAGMPRGLRGVITITNLTRTDSSWKTIAHELGHKLLNVSHEYGETSPQHEVNADGGLMLYGQGTDIPSGAEGRYHYERLHRSPFVYRETDGGERHYNPDYHTEGFYYDDIYEGISVEFGPGT